jgi:DegV family protein with EDD domain
MHKVAVVTDSVADIPPQLAEELGITIVPLILRFGTDVYRDSLDISPDDYYKKLATAKVLPKTSTPPPLDFAEVFDRLSEKTDSILYIGLSSKLSGTFQVAVQSVGLMKKKCRIELMDSQWAAMAQGFIVITATRAAIEGKNLDEVIAVANRAINRVGLCAAFNTLEYLERGGRIGKAQALLGSLLKINPIIGVKDGVVVPLGKKRSRGKAIDYLYNYAADKPDIEALAVEYATDREETYKLVARMQTKFPNVPVYVSRATPAIGTHTGPGLIVVSIMTRSDIRL